MERDLIETLMGAGLTEGEAKTYLALNSIGTSTVGAIITESGVSGSKVYRILERLMQKGLVSVITKNGKKIYSPLPASMVLNYLDEQKKKIETSKERVKDILPLLEARRESKSDVPIVEFAKGSKGFATLREKMVDMGREGDAYLALTGTRVSFKMQTFWYGLSQRLAERKMIQMNTYLHNTWHEKDPIIHRRKERKNFYPVVLDKKYKHLPNIAILGDNMAMSDLDEQGEIFTMLIHNRNLVQSFTRLLYLVRDLGTVPKGFKEKD